MRFISSLTPQQAFISALLFATAQALPALAPISSLKARDALTPTPTPQTPQTPTPTPTPQTPQTPIPTPSPGAEGGNVLKKRETSGGGFNLINGTPYKWVRTYYEEKQIDGTWDREFEAHPTIEPNGGSARLGIEFERAFSDLNPWEWMRQKLGKAIYNMEGCIGKDQAVCTFSLRAKGFGEGIFEVYGTPNNFDALGYPAGTEITLGWVHEGECAWILAGDLERGIATSMPPVDWMKQSFSTIGNRKLKDVCMPGSHDAGMSVETGGTALASEDNALTQWHPIADQLTYGSRYFDIRPVLAGGQMYTGHYSKAAGLSWQGLNGQKISDIISQINAFTDNNAELVILNFSHDRNTDNGREYEEFDQTLWNQLFDELTHAETGLKRLHIAQNLNTNFANEPLKKFITGAGKGAVLVLIDPGRGAQISLDAVKAKGLYAHSQFNLYDSYSEKRDPEEVAPDQIRKMVKNPRPFILSWTITLDDFGNVVDGDIREEGDKMNDLLWYKLPPTINKDKYPTVIYLDSIGRQGRATKNNYAALAMAINYIAQP